jgi:hypothetical protein
VNSPKTIVGDIFISLKIIYILIAKLTSKLNLTTGTIHEKVNGKGYFYSWKDPSTAAVEEDWLGGRNYCRQRCMDLVSLETSAENELIKRRIVEGKVKNIILIFCPVMNGYIQWNGRMYSGQPRFDSLLGHESYPLPPSPCHIQNVSDGNPDTYAEDTGRPMQHWGNGARGRCLHKTFSDLLCMPLCFTPSTILYFEYSVVSLLQGHLGSHFIP